MTAQFHPRMIEGILFHECELCAALVTKEGRIKHADWHQGQSARLNEAAQIGARADMMITPLGEGGIR